jgi:hypothetical protein
MLKRSFRGTPEAVKTGRGEHTADRLFPGFNRQMPARGNS